MQKQEKIYTKWLINQVLMKDESMMRANADKMWKVANKIRQTESLNSGVWLKRPWLVASRMLIEVNRIIKYM